LNVRVEYMAQLRTHAGCREESFTLHSEATLEDLLRAIAGLHGDAMRKLLFNDNDAPASTVLCFVSSEQSDWNRTLTEDALVTLMTPISGG